MEVITVTSIAWTLLPILRFSNLYSLFTTLIYTSLKIADGQYCFFGLSNQGAMIYIFCRSLLFRLSYLISIYHSLIRWLIVLLCLSPLRPTIQLAISLQEKNGLFNIGGLILVSFVFFSSFRSNLGQGPRRLRADRKIENISPSLKRYKDLKMIKI